MIYKVLIAVPREEGRVGIKSDRGSQSRALEFLEIFASLDARTFSQLSAYQNAALTVDSDETTIEGSVKCRREQKPVRWVMPVFAVLAPWSDVTSI